MEVTLNRSRLQEIHEVLRHLTDRRSPSSLSDKILVRAEPGHISVVATNGCTDVFYRAVAAGNQTAGQCLISLPTLADLAKGKEDSVQLAGESRSSQPVAATSISGCHASRRTLHRQAAISRLRPRRRNPRCQDEGPGLPSRKPPLPISTAS